MASASAIETTSCILERTCYSMCMGQQQYRPVGVEATDVTHLAAAVPCFRVLGTSDDYTECQLCGRSDLKSTIALAPLDADGNVCGETVYYGSDCGARAAGWTESTITRAARVADEATAVEAARVRRLAADEADRALDAWLVAQTGQTDRLAQLKALGGFSAAMAAYRSRQ
jgi:hypothetical protein